MVVGHPEAVNAPDRAMGMPIRPQQVGESWHPVLPWHSVLLRSGANSQACTRRQVELGTGKRYG